MTEEEATTAQECEEGEDCPPAEDENATEEAAIDPATDTLPGLLLGIQAMIGTAWWLVTMFVYVGNSASDKLTSGTSTDSTIPLIWMWGNLGSTTVGWQALSHLFTLIFYLAISVIELVAWIVWKTGDGDFAKLWIGTIGFWGSLIGYVVPPVFAMLHLIMPTASGGINGTAATNGYTHDLFLMIGGFTLWIAHGLLHILFAARFVAHIDAQECVCSEEAVAELAEDADDEAKTAHDAATAAYEEACAKECPPEDTCTLEQEEDESDEDFQARCEAEAAKAAEEGEPAEEEASEGGWD